MTATSPVICAPVRTPIGRYGGMFKSLTAVELGVAALRGLLQRNGIPAEAVQDVILGHCYPSSEAPAIGRVVALDAGLPVTVPGMQVDRRCGSGLQAVIQACMQVASGANDLVIAGGAESMSNVAFHSTDMRWGGSRGGITVHDGLARGRTTAGGKNYPVPGGMLETAENLRRQCAISRVEQDALAVRSHQKAVAAQRSGVLADEIVPVMVSSRTGDQVIDTDEHPRADTTVEALGKLKPVLGKNDPDATVTAGNSSGQNDAASMCIVTTPARGRTGAGAAGAAGVVGCGRGAAERHGHRTGAGHRGRARVHGVHRAGVVAEHEVSHQHRADEPGEPPRQHLSGQRRVNRAHQHAGDQT